MYQVHEKLSKLLKNRKIEILDFIEVLYILKASVHEVLS